MDILYYIGSGSRHNNEELRYSLRSLQAHCKDIGNLWIVGNRPAFLTDNVKYLWVEDEQHWYHNSIKKIVSAIKAGITNKFLLMNDDFFMLDDFAAENYPIYHRGEIAKLYDTEYHQVLSNTRELLEKAGLPFRHYGVHCPMIVEGDKFMSLSQYFNEKIDFRCLYGNYFCRGIKTFDCKGDEVRKHKTKCFSTKSWAPEALSQLKKMFPAPSKWEK